MFLSASDSWARWGARALYLDLRPNPSPNLSITMTITIASNSISPRTSPPAWAITSPSPRRQTIARRIGLPDRVDARFALACRGNPWGWVTFCECPRAKWRFSVSNRAHSHNPGARGVESPILFHRSLRICTQLRGCEAPDRLGARLARPSHTILPSPPNMRNSDDNRELNET